MTDVMKKLANHMAHKPTYSLTLSDTERFRVRLVAFDWNGDDLWEEFIEPGQAGDLAKGALSLLDEEGMELTLSQFNDALVVMRMNQMAVQEVQPPTMTLTEAVSALINRAGKGCVITIEGVAWTVV